MNITRALRNALCIHLEDIFQVYEKQVDITATELCLDTVKIASEESIMQESSGDISETMSALSIPSEAHAECDIRLINSRNPHLNKVQHTDA